MRVLLVDDEQELVETLAERLGIRGMDARWATNGDAALGLIDQEDFDLAVLDIKIPGINGIDLHKIMKEKQLLLPRLLQNLKTTASRQVVSLQKENLKIIKERSL